MAAGLIVGLAGDFSFWGWREALKSGAGLFLCVGAICSIAFSLLKYEVYEELAYLTRHPLFLWAFWLLFSVILAPIGIICYIIAWAGVKKIQGADSFKPNSAARLLIVVVWVVFLVLALTNMH